MIYIDLDDESFQYDVYHLIQAFYPKEEITQKEQVKQKAFENQSLNDNDSVSIKVSVTTTNDEVCVGIIETNKSNEIVCSQKKQCDYSDRKETKNIIKQALYEALSDYTKQKLPWGTLTGIRPTKIARRLIEDGATKDDVLSHMKDVYLASDEKSELSYRISKTEWDLIDTFDYKNGYSLYIGIPFCPTTCLYCSFTSYPIAIWKDSVDSYLDALKKELKATASLMANRPLQTIYMGGGTPTSLSAEQIDDLLAFVKSTFNLDDLLECTIEAGRPDSITREKLLAMKKHSFVDRISINPQTMNQETLDLIGRRHTVEDIVSCYEMARELGFSNINMDLILGLPGETKEMVAHTFDEIKKLSPDSVTVHSLAIKRASRLNIEWDKYENYLMENSSSLMDEAIFRCEDMGLLPYYLYRQKNIAGNQENIGFAKPNQASLYNILIMEELQPILACGAGSASKYVFYDGSKTQRTEDVKDVKDYISRIDEMIMRKQNKLEELQWL